MCYCLEIITVYLNVVEYSRPLIASMPNDEAQYDIEREKRERENTFIRQN